MQHNYEIILTRYSETKRRQGCEPQTENRVFSVCHSLFLPTDNRRFCVGICIRLKKRNRENSVFFSSFYFPTSYANNNYISCDVCMGNTLSMDTPARYPQQKKNGETDRRLHCIAKTPTDQGIT